jgi:HK97 gp10 family phage protein
MATTMRLSGNRELETLLRKLPDRLAKNVTFAALRAGARIVQKAAQTNLIGNGSVDTGALVAAQKISTRRRSRKGAAVVAVGTDKLVRMALRKGRSKTIKINPRNYAHLVEFGTEHSAAKPFMRPAMDQNGEAALVKILEMSAKGIEREAAALAGGRKSFATGKKI